MTIAASVLHTIGNTPHIRVNRIFGDKAQVWLKSERSNPGGSIKDRIALAMIEEAEASGKLKPGGVIYVKVPNYATVNRMVRGREWCGFRFPDHLNYFEPASLKRLAEAEGYTMTVKNKATIFTNDNMHVFLQKRAG